MFSKENTHACVVCQSCPTLCNPLGCNPPGPSVHGIFQASILEWVAMPSSRGSSLPRDRSHVSCTAGRFFTAEPLGKLTSQGLTHVFILSVSPVYYFHQHIYMVYYVPFIKKNLQPSYCSISLFHSAQFLEVLYKVIVSTFIFP